jgi:hypothetical protein
MALTSYIGIESFHHFDDDVYKKIIINRLLDAEDVTNIFKSYLFISKEENECKMKMQHVLCNIKFASVCIRQKDDTNETWAFCGNRLTNEKQFQATNCGICGEYVNTSTIYFLCAENAKCTCQFDLDDE